VAVVRPQREDRFREPIIAKETNSHFVIMAGVGGIG
jgi:hypothetical protein